MKKPNLDDKKYRYFHKKAGKIMVNNQKYAEDCRKYEEYCKQMESVKIQYSVTFRNIPIEAMFTPIIYIQKETVAVYAKGNAVEYDLQMAIHERFKWLMPEHIRIESFHPLENVT